MLKINGWVTPRYLDYHWCKNFSVSRDKSKSVDIPVTVRFETRAYKGAFLDNRIKSYGDLEDEIILLKKRIKEEIQ